MKTRYRIRIGKTVVVDAEAENEEEIKIARKLVEEVSRKLGIEVELETMK